MLLPEIFLIRVPLATGEGLGVRYIKAMPPLMGFCRDVVSFCYSYVALTEIVLLPEIFLISVPLATGEGLGVRYIEAVHSLSTENNELFGEIL